MRIGQGRSRLTEIHAVPAHQFDDLDQQREASSLGMWVFLVTEIMFFGGMFTGYTVYRHAYPEVFADASRRLSVVLGALNTSILICSSLTMALAVHSAQLGKRKPIMVWLALTIVFGGIFLGIKAVEYSHKFHEHLIPGPNFAMEGPFAQQAQLFFTLYFAMTGTHAAHMVVGIGIIAALIYKASKGRFSAEYNSPVELTGIYWHFVDIVWIFLYPLLYLLGRH
jgi:cytochrome c oxidase subunit 3